MKKQKAHKVEVEEKIKVSTLVYGILILIVVFLGISSILAYGTNSEIGKNIAGKISTVIPFPAAIVDWRHTISIDDLQANLLSVEKFYQTQDFAKEGLRVDFTTEDGKKRLRIKEREILDKMVEDKVIEILAKQRGISVSSSDVNGVVDAKLNEFGTAEDVKGDLLKSYGWSLDDFKSRVVLPGLYTDALAQKVVSDELNNDKAKAKIVEAKKQLDGGKDFADVVRSYSEGPSKEKGGELGWATKDQVAPELAAALFGDAVPEKNSIIESSIGFHIIDIENRKKENGVDVLQLRQIFVAKNTFVDWLLAQKKKMQIAIPLADFTWNAQDGIVDFRDQQMRDFEKKARANSQGDASITF